MTKEEAIKILEEGKQDEYTRQTICGYDIEHLMLIAHFLRKENLPPERVTEVLSDIGHIVTIVIGAYEELLRKAIENIQL